MKLTILTPLILLTTTTAAVVINSAVINPAYPKPVATTDFKPIPPIQSNLDSCKGKKNGTPCKWLPAPGRGPLGKDGKGLDGQCLQITLPNQKPQPITCVSFALWKRASEE